MTNDCLQQSSFYAYSKQKVRSNIIWTTYLTCQSCLMITAAIKKQMLNVRR